MNSKPDKLMPALYGGIIMALISGIPGLNLINCLCCAGIMLGGFLAVFFYRKETGDPSLPFTAGDAAIVGLLAGVFGAVFGVILSSAIRLAFGNFEARLVGSLFERWATELPPEIWDSIRESLGSPLNAVSLMVSFFTSLVLDVLFGLLGGLIGYVVFKPKVGSMVPPPPAPLPSS